MMAFPPPGRDDSSTLRELGGVLAFVMAAGSGTPPGGDGEPLPHVHHGLRGAPFAVARWAASGSVSLSQADHLNFSLQALAAALLDAQIERRFQLTFK